MKKYLLIAAIGCGFAHEAGAMKREEFEQFQKNALVVIDSAKKTHDSFFSQEKESKKNIDAIRIFFDDQEKILTKILQQENGFLKLQKEQLEKRKLSLDLNDVQEKRQFSRDNKLLLADQSKFEQDCNELVCVLHKYRKAIDSGCKLGDAKKTDSTPLSLKSFFSDRWAVASVAYLTAYFAAIAALVYYKVAR